MVPLLALAFLGLFGELFADANFILKIFVLLAIISWVKNHVGGGALSLLLLGGFTYLIFFSDIWAIFGGAYLLYTLLMIGVASIIIDYLFVSAGVAPNPEGVQSPLSTGVDVAARMARMQRMRRGPGG